jgi:hypothetical protein
MLGAVPLFRHIAASLAVPAAMLALAGPALAAPGDPAPGGQPGTTAVQQDGVEPPATVGPGQVITDPASETEPQVTTVEEQPVAGDPLADAPTPQRGELHVLSSVASQSAPPAPAAARSSDPRLPADTTVTRTVVRSRAATLPFTGVNAELIALSGLALLAGGLLARRAALYMAAA